MKSAETKTTAARPPLSMGRSEHRPFFQRASAGRDSLHGESAFFTRPPVQTKLQIGAPGDRYEREADHMADQVVQKMAVPEHERQPADSPGVQRLRRKPIFESAGVPETQAKAIAGCSGRPPLLQAKCAECRQQEELQRQEAPEERALQREFVFESAAYSPPEEPSEELQRSPGSGLLQLQCTACENEESQQLQRQSSAEGSTVVPEGLSDRLERNRGSGATLPDTTRQQMEGTFGADFSGVRIHTGSEAVQMTESVQAHAFTHGNNIYFNTGKYDPGSVLGQRLLAHELTHTVQQGASVRRQKQAPGEEKNEFTSGTENVQRDLLGDAWAVTGGKITGAAIEFVFDQIRPSAPSLVLVLEQIRSVGVANFFKSKLMQGVDGIFHGLQDNSALLANIFPQFGGLLARAQVIIHALASGDCEPLFAAINDLKALVTQMAGDAWDAIVAFFQPATDFFTEIYQSFALSAMEWLQTKAAHVWNWVQQIGKNIWQWLLPVRETIGDAWDYLKGIIGLNADETSEEGFIQWAQRKAAEVWEMVKEQLRPILEPARAMVARIQALVPLTAILNLRATIQDWLQKVIATSTAMGADASGVGDEAAQTSLRDQILPAVQQSLESFRGSIASAAFWVSGTIGELHASVGQFFTSVRSIGVLSAASDVIDWVEAKAASLHEWVQSKASALFDAASQGLHAFGEFLRPVYDTLVKVFEALGNLLDYSSDLLMGPLWKGLPRCIKDPIKEFFLTQILGRLPFFQKLQQIEGVWDHIKAAALVILKQVFIDGNLKGAIWTFFSSMLEILGLPPSLVMQVIAKAAKSLSDMLNDPLGFLSNILASLKLGFGNYFSNVRAHLLSGIQSWLFSQLEGTGIDMPQDYSFKSILKLAFQVLGISVESLVRIVEEVTGRKNLKERIQRMIGAVSTAWEWFEKLLSQGEEDDSFWDRLSSKIGNIWNIILDRVVGWIEKTIVARAIAWIAKKLDPTGVMAVITTVIDVFNVLTAIAEKAKEVLTIIDGVFDKIVDIIKGVLTVGADVVERALGLATPVAMTLLAALIGIDGVVDQLKESIQALREKVEEGIRWVVTKINNFIVGLLVGGDPKKEGKDTVEAALQEVETEGKVESDGGEITLDEAQAIKNKVNQDHSTVIEISSVNDGGNNWEFVYVQKSSILLPKTKCPAPGHSAPGLGLVQKHGAQPPRNRRGPLVHHTQSEHIIPFATARSLLLALGFTERARKVLGRFDRGMITLMIYRGAAERKNDQDNVYSAAFESQMIAARIIEKTRQAKQQFEGGNKSGGQSLAREVVSSVTSALETLRRSAVERTKLEIQAEWASTEKGCVDTNGRRRGESVAQPLDAVEGAADQQLDGIITFAQDTLLANASRE